MVVVPRSQSDVIEAHTVGALVPLSPCPLISLSQTGSIFLILALMGFRVQGSGFRVQGFRNQVPNTKHQSRSQVFCFQAKEHFSPWYRSFHTVFTAG